MYSSPPLNQNQPAVGAWETLASIFFMISSRDSLPILTVLGAVKGDVYDGHQTLTGVQSAEQPVWVGLAQDLQDVTFVEAQLPWFSGNVVTQSSHFTGTCFFDLCCFGCWWCGYCRRLGLLLTSCSDSLSYKIKNGPVQTEPA